MNIEEDDVPIRRVKVRRIEEAIAWTKISIWNKEPHLWLYGPLFYRPLGPRDYTNCPLSQREVDVIELLAEGMTNKQAGAVLGLSELTVKSHLARIAKRLEVTGDRSGLVAFAIRAGWID